MSNPSVLHVTLAGVRSATHLVHAGSFLRHLLSETSDDVVVDYLGSGQFLGRDNVRPEHVEAFLPVGPRLQLRSGTTEIGASQAGGVRQHLLLSVGAPGIKPWLRLVSRIRRRPRVVVLDEGIGTYGDWRTRRDAWRRQGGREPWPTVRSWAVSGAADLLTDQRWALYEREQERDRGTWRVVPEVAAGFTEALSSDSTVASGQAVYLTQPWVELGLVSEADFGQHLAEVARACSVVGLELAIRPHPAEEGGRYAAWRELPREVPAELDPAVVGAPLVLGTDSTALLNLAAVHGRPAVRVTLRSLEHLERALSRDQRELLDTFLPAPVRPDAAGDLEAALARALGA
ncbi:hypothetical protein [Knoellia subterranea]|uniref:hypothetical protein n=1 Tax=Knoellia subterranea TaxID=184882 RepID=UPI000A7114D5|nr:hypothetical protein [Knoellia subterranea]